MPYSSKITRMFELGKKHSEILHLLYHYVQPGLKTLEVEHYYIQLLNKFNIKSACKNYKPTKRVPPYPTHLCLSINNQCVHSYPTKEGIIKDNDLVFIDTVVTDGTVFTDAAFSKVMDKNKKLPLVHRRLQQVATAKASLRAALGFVRAGNNIGMISYAIYQVAKKSGFDVLREYGGHGIGYNMWEDPHIPNIGYPGEGPELKENSTIAVETLITSGSPEIEHVNKWATRLKDGGDYAQWEYTLLVTKDGYKVIAGLQL